MMRARHMVARPRELAERQRIEASLRPSARELFPVLRERLLNSRPVIGERVVKLVPEGRKKVRAITEPVYGPPTFRNIIDKNGAWV